MSSSERGDRIKKQRDRERERAWALAGGQAQFKTDESAKEGSHSGRERPDGGTAFIF